MCYMSLQQLLNSATVSTKLVIDNVEMNSSGCPKKTLFTKTGSGPDFPMCHSLTIFVLEGVHGKISSIASLALERTWHKGSRWYQS